MNFTRCEPSIRLDLIMVISGLLDIYSELGRLITCTVRQLTPTGFWKVKVIALSEAGSTLITSLPEKSTELERAIDGLEYFLQKGKLMTGQV